MRSNRRGQHDGYPRRGVGTRPVRWLAAALLAATATVLPACATKPTMQVKSAQVTGIGLTGVGVNITTTITNRNSFDIQVRHVSAQVTIANRYMMGPIDTQPNVWLGAKQATDVVTPVVIPWPLVLPLLAETVGTENIPYHVQGYADVTATRALGVQVNNEAVDDSGIVPRSLILSAARINFPNAR